jgi:phospholipase/lecithinase/hemolysin
MDGLMTQNPDLIRQVDLAISENLAFCDAVHPVVSVHHATAAVMAKAHVDADDRPEVMMMICRRSLMRRHVLAFT